MYFTFVYLKSMRVTRDEGAQQSDRGIQRGLVNMTRITTQNTSARTTMIRLDWRNSCSMSMSVKRKYLSKSFATHRDLERKIRLLGEGVFYFFWKKE
jgi:hypothetical protein